MLYARERRRTRGDGGWDEDRACVFHSLATVGDHAMIKVRSLRIKAWCLTGARFSLLATLAVVAGGCGASKERISEVESRGIYQPLIHRLGYLLEQSPEMLASGERYYFLRNLGETRDPAAYTVLARMLRRGNLNSHETYVASTALAAIGDPRAFDVLKKAVETGRLSQIQGVIAFGILAVSGENAEALNYVLRASESDPDVEVRCYAVSALRSVHRNHAAATAALERMARSDASMRVRARAACVLVDHGDKSYWEFVNSAARHPDAKVRLEVAERVPFHPEAIPLLLHLLGDEDVGVRYAAWESLEKNLAVGNALPPGRPSDAEPQRKAYRKAWEKSQRK